MNSMSKNSFGAAAKLRAGETDFDYFRLARLEETEVGNISKLPFSTVPVDPKLAKNAEGDPDFEPLRKDPRWAKTMPKSEG